MLANQNFQLREHGLEMRPRRLRVGRASGRRVRRKDGRRKYPQLILRGIRDGGAKHHRAAEQHREVVDRGREHPARTEKMKRLGFRAEIQPVALQCERVAGLDGRLQVEEQVGRIRRASGKASR